MERNRQLSLKQNKSALTNLEIRAVRGEVERRGAEAMPSFLCDDLVVEDEPQVVDDISLDVRPGSILGPPVLSRLELVVAEAPLAVLFSPHYSLCWSLSRWRRRRRIPEEGDNHLAEVRQIFGARESPFDEDDGQVLSVSYASRQNVHRSPVANLIEVDEVLIPCTPWDVASVKKFIKPYCPASQIGVIFERLPVRLVVELPIQGEGHLIHRDEVG